MFFIYQPDSVDWLFQGSFLEPFQLVQMDKIKRKKLAKN